MTKEYEQVLQIIDSIKQLLNQLKVCGEVQESRLQITSDISAAVEAINDVVLGTEKLDQYDIKSVESQFINGNIGVSEYITIVINWINIITTCIEEFTGYKNIVDRKFYRLMKYVQLTNYDIMVENTIKLLENMREKQSENYQAYCSYYTFYQDFWGGLNLDNGVYDVVKQRMSALIEHKDEFINLYELLNDYRSKKVLCNILLNYISFDYSLLTSIKENNYADYYDFDLIPQTDDNEVFVDLGAYKGDSANEFISQYNQHYKRIYCYEITKKNYAILEEQVKNEHDVICKCKGVGEKNGFMYMKEFGISGTSNSLCEDQNSGYEVEVVSLDDDIKEKITWIKMDIEGAEQAAILGCKKHIANEKPKLTICTYHNNEDIWKIPQMIKQLNSDYKFYMRYNGKQIGPSEYVLYCL